ncbi:MAG: hypothetical protein ACLFWD_04585 [Anaerolineales bacterium]
MAGALQQINPGEPLPLAEVLDICAYIDLCLQAIVRTVDQTAQAWEARDYWVKADKFRFEWAWADKAQSSFRQALEQRNVDALRVEAASLKTELAEITPYKKDLKDPPWTGSWQRWQEREAD